MAIRKELSSNLFEKMYDDLGIRLPDLGCVMLDIMPSIELIKIKNELKDEDYFYYSKNKDHWWIDGFVACKTPHVTLLYGLIGPAEMYKPYIDQVLDGWSIKEVEVEKIGYFDSPYDDEKYKCIVAYIKITPNLLEGHQRLEFLPHINTFPGYKAHFTLAYVKDDKVGIKCIDTFSKLVGKKLNIKEKLNLGKK